MLHASLDGLSTVGETLGHLLLPFMQRSWVTSLTFNETTLEIAVTTVLQSFAMSLSRLYSVVFDCLAICSSILVLLTSTADAVSWQ